MKIETKYDIGQEVWFEYSQKPQKGIVSSISLTITGKFNEDDDILYHVRPAKCSPYRICVSEKDLFPTKEELLKSL